MTTISYELAKELKDAGFPQSEACSFAGCRHGMDEGIDCVYIPTISDLIEACGEQRDGRWLGLLFTGTLWEGGYYKALDGFPVYEPHANGETREEVMSNLYLILNPQKREQPTRTDFSVRKQIGRVFESDYYFTKCECGEVAQMQQFLLFLPHIDKSKQESQSKFMAFCACGNIFIAS